MSDVYSEFNDRYELTLINRFAKSLKIVKGIVLDLRTKKYFQLRLVQLVEEDVQTTPEANKLKTDISVMDG